MHEKKKKGSSWRQMRIVSFLNGEASLPLYLPLPLSFTRGPAHDKTKRLNDLWMWLSIFFSH